MFYRERDVMIEGACGISAFSFSTVLIFRYGGSAVLLREKR
jgi:hypothetical protein